MRKVALHTLGCKLNFAETSAIGKQFLDRGFEIVESGEDADICVINTCTVTERADRECRQIIRRMLRQGRQPVVVVTGCYAQLQPEEIASIDGVDVVLGTREKFSVFEYLPDAKLPSPQVHVSDIDTVDSFGPAYSSEAANRTRAFLKVQDGCDYTCSFCTIPLARGDSRSQSLPETIDQARSLVARGYREIVLTGVNVGDYGRKDGRSLLELLRALSSVEGLERIRVSSIEPNLLTDALIEFVAATKTMCRHFHIPLQSGCDDVLRVMRRRYTTSGYARLIDRIRRILPDAGIGADVIVGFPGETDEFFRASYEFLTGLDLSYLHVFTYSERTNTPAATLGGRVEPSVRARRSEMLRILSQKKRHAFYRQSLGKPVTVLMESEIADGLRLGFTDTYVRVGLPASHTRENTLVRAVVDDVQDTLCIGSLCEERMPA